MAVSAQAQVDLVNQALRALGEKPITIGPEPDNPRWLLAQQFYTQVQDTLLTEHGWAFATIRTALTGGAGSVWGWTHAYPLPADYLAIQRTDDAAIFQREGAVIFSNDTPFYLTYTARVEDVTKWPSYFVSAFVAALTVAFAEQITGQLDKHKIWFEIAQRRLQRAIELNDREGSPIQAQSILGSGPGRDLVNQALRPLGDLPHQSRYLLADRFFGQVWERLLCAHFWNFATVRAVLSPAAGVTPPWGYTHAFAVPTDYLAAQRTEDSQPYAREGGYFLASTPTLSLTYTAKIEDVTKWSGAFQSAFVAALTAEFAAQFPEHHKNLEAWLKIADEKLQRAKILDDLEDAPIQAHGTFASGPARDLVNQALRPLGDLPRQSRFLLADEFFVHIYERLLASHFWNFATVRVVLSPAAGVSPAWGFANAFAVPPDYLHVQRVQTGIRYQREGAYFVSDEASLPLTYTRKVPDVTQWPPYFAAAFVAALTAEIAMQVPEQQQKALPYLQTAEGLLKRAKTQDGQEGSSPLLQMPDLIRARWGGRAGGWR